MVLFERAALNPGDIGGWNEVRGSLCGAADMLTVTAVTDNTPSGQPVLFPLDVMRLLRKCVLTFPIIYRPPGSPAPSDTMSGSYE